MGNILEVSFFFLIMFLCSAIISKKKNLIHATSHLGALLTLKYAFILNTCNKYYCILVVVVGSYISSSTQIAVVFVATAGVGRSSHSPGVDNHFHTPTPCAALLGETTRPNG